MAILSCVDWQDRIRAGQSLIPAGAIGLNPAESKRALAIFDQLRLPDIPGTPLLADAAGEWFRELVAVFLGALDQLTHRPAADPPTPGARLIRELFLLAPKKSSKTSYGAALMLTALLANLRPRAEFLLIAPTQSVAELAFNQAAGMIDLDEELHYRKEGDGSSSGMQIQHHLRCITRWHHGEQKGQLRIKSFDSGVLTGVRPAGVLLDELHEIAKKPQATNVIGQIRGGLLAVPEAFLATITTQSDRPPVGVFRSELKMARAIRNGEAEGSILPVLYEFPDQIRCDHSDPPAWSDPALWPMVSPNLGRPATIERLIEEFRTACEKGPDEKMRWASQHLNIELGAATGTGRWVGADLWPDAVEPGIDLTHILRQCDVAVVGFDNGGMDDMFAGGVLGRERDTGRWLFWARAWLHKIGLERRKSEASRYLDLKETGDLVIVDHMVDAVFEAADIVDQVNDAGLLPKENAIGLDRIGIGQLPNELAGRGFEHPQVVSITQGYQLQAPIKTTEVALDDGTLVHGGQMLMDYAVNNCRVEARGNGIIITKQASGTAKIDAAIAMFNCVALMSLNPVAAGQSIYETMSHGLARELGLDPVEAGDTTNRFMPIEDDGFEGSFQ